MSLRRLVTELASVVRPARQKVVAPHKPTDELEDPEDPIVVRAWWNDREGAWEAIEGSHRLAVAARDNLLVTIQPVQLDDAFPNRNLDGSDVIGWDSTIEIASVKDALQIFRGWSKRPVYNLRVEL